MSTSRRKAEAKALEGLNESPNTQELEALKADHLEMFKDASQRSATPDNINVVDNVLDTNDAIDDENGTNGVVDGVANTTVLNIANVPPILLHESEYLCGLPLPAFKTGPGRPIRNPATFYHDKLLLEHKKLIEQGVLLPGAEIGAQNKPRKEKSRISQRLQNKNKMDASNPSVGSNMSSTQEIPSQHYSRFRGTDAMRSSTGDDEENMGSQSTTEKADTGRVSTFEFDHETLKPTTQQQNVDTQWTSDSPANVGKHNFIAPETPANRNPFQGQARSVLPPGELFQATQPTPTGETQTNGITPHHPSPYGIGMNPGSTEPVSSPLQRLAHGARLSSPEHQIAASFSEGQNELKATSGSRAQFSASMHEPRAEYVSVKESQQRRELLRAASAPDESQESDDGFDDIHELRRRATAERRKATRGLANISARNPVAEIDDELQNDNVEVPSTANRQRDARRRSDAEEFEAQCHGTDARDTQGDDQVIADSQRLDQLPQPDASKSTKSSQIVKESSLLAPVDTQGAQAITQSQTSTQDDSTDETAKSPAKVIAASSSPDLPEIVTPKPRRISKNTVIPESSPAKDGVADGLRSFTSIVGSSGQTASSLNEAPSPFPIPSMSEDEAVVASPSSPVRSGPTRKITLDEIVVSPVTKPKKPSKKEQELSEMVDLPKPDISLGASTRKRQKNTYTKKGSPAKKSTEEPTLARQVPTTRVESTSRTTTPQGNIPEITGADDDETPMRATRSRRHAASKVAKDEGFITSPARSIRANATDGNANGMFAGMLFVITSSTNEKKKVAVEKEVIKHGGTVLSEGFGELFDTAAITFSPPGKTTPATRRKSDSSSSLVLSKQASEASFACVLASTHVRTPKYLQALALGLPCLSTHWVENCLAEGRIIDWEFYLLCAGDSTSLGATRGRVMTPYDAATSKLVNVFDARKLPLQDKKVLVIVGTTSKQEEAALVAVFLMRILGASKIGRAKDSAEARELLVKAETTPDAWEILFTNKEHTNQEKDIFEASEFPKLGKRKRASVSTTDGTPAPDEIPMINSETIIQGLIDGRLEI